MLVELPSDARWLAWLWTRLNPGFTPYLVVHLISNLIAIRFVVLARYLFCCLAEHWPFLFT